jgi:NMT1/THI5 like
MRLLCHGKSGDFQRGGSKGPQNRGHTVRRVHGFCRAQAPREISFEAEHGCTDRADRRDARNRAALSKGAIAAAPMSYPLAYVAQKNGMKLLTNMAKEDIAFVHVGITTSRKFLQQHRDETKAFLRAYGRAVHFMHTDKKGFEKILSKSSKVVDPGMLEGTVQYAYDFVEKIPLVKRQAFQVTLDLVGEKRPAAKQAQPTQFYDNSLIEELVKEGFFKKLWGEDFQSQASSGR